MKRSEAHPETEARHPGTFDLDELTTLEFVRLMNAEDARVAVAIAGEAEAIARAIDGISERMAKGGRLIYLGAGTSGRLGVMDASECPATFGTGPDLVVGVLAGGEAAFAGSIEDAEDDEGAGTQAARDLAIGELDSVVGISASGRTRYVIGGLTESRRRGALIIAISGTRDSPIADLASVAISPVVGPEVLAGSTRLKAGTAQKMVLNMLSTGVMVRLGKTYGNLMVDVSPKNAKLRERARRIVEEAVGIPAGDAEVLLRRADGDVKVAIVAGLSGVEPSEARQRLRARGGVVRLALPTGGAATKNERP
jgi:N-acetylmuramic acid 6-phosphate etherase